MLVVRDATGVTLAWLYCRDDTQRCSYGASELSSDEARRIGKAIVRIPKFLMPRQGFYPRGGLRWRAWRIFHRAARGQYECPRLQRAPTPMSEVIAGRSVRAG